MSARAVRALVALAFLAGSAWLAVTREPRLGLDLRGGTQIVLETQSTSAVKADADATDRALEVLRRRVDALGVSEPSLARSGQRRIIVELPGVQDPREAAKVIGRTAQLTFHGVTGSEPLQQAPSPTNDTSHDTSKPLTLPADGELLHLAPAALTGNGVKDASAQLSEFGTAWTVSVTFNGRGDDAWADLTGKAACAAPGTPERRVAIVLDGRVISSPQVDPSIQCERGIAGGATEITGDFDRTEAMDLAALVKGGALPVPVEVIEQRTVGPTLGSTAIAASRQAAVIGLALTAVFLVLVYRLVGLLASIALATYGVLSYGALVGLGATLTLPGLAGLLLSAGLAIDANVLVFERAREEHAASRGRNLPRALEAGFRNAWSAIADSNATTLLAAGLLFQLASGPVRGFGVTLCLGVLASMVSALLVTRVLAETAVASRLAVRRPSWLGITDIGRFRRWLVRRDPDLMRRQRTWLAVSAAAVVLASGGILARGLTFGVEFTGGRLVEVSTTRELDVERARELVAGAGYPRAVVQESGERNLSVRDAALDDDDVIAVRQALAPIAGETEVVRDELIGPSLGAELRVKAGIALVVALAMQLLYLAVRFRWTFAAAAVIAMLHDLVIVIGLFAWMGKTIDAVFLAAALTVIGVSVNDTIVTLDRIRETWSAKRDVSLRRAANQGVLDTAPRTINTGIGAMFILASLTLLGGDTLTDFALAVLIGLVVGTWSSAFTATPLLLLLQRWSSAPPPMPKARPATGRRRPAPRLEPRPGEGAVI
jgi:SecD/SecF fusion protein